jgi:hypothetical protein
MEEPRRPQSRRWSPLRDMNSRLPDSEKNFNLSIVMYDLTNL